MIYAQMQTAPAAVRKLKDRRILAALQGKSIRAKTLSLARCIDDLY